MLEDKVLDYNTAEAVNGEMKGNVITDIDSTDGVDVLPEGTKVTAVETIDVSGQAQKKNLGEDLSTTIEGLYGTLTIHADGSYTYVIKESFNGVFGESKDVFTYTVSANGSDATAKLEILIDNKIPEPKPVSIFDTIIVNPQVAGIELKGNDKVQNLQSFELLQVGLLDPILSAKAVDLSAYRQFSVGENMVRELTMKGDAGGIAVGVSFTLLIYRKDEVTGNYVQYHVEKDWYQAVLLGGVSKPLTVSFPEGDYIARIGHGGLLGLAVGSTLSFEKDIIFNYGNPSDNSVTGTSSKDVTAVETDVITSFEGAKPVDGKVTHVGKYGTIIINTDGTYTYTLNRDSTSWKEVPYGKVEAFTYVVKDESGSVRVEELNIEISLAKAQDDFKTVPLAASNHVEQAELNLANGLVKVIDYTLTVNNGYATQAGKLVFETTYALKEGRSITYTIENTVTKEIITGTLIGSNEDKYVNETPIANLNNGIYKVTAKLVGFPSSTYFTADTAYVTQIVNLNAYTVAETILQGSIAENDVSSVKVQSYSIGSETVSNLFGASRITVEGKYGVLVLKNDGTYNYTPSGKDGGVEEFTYIVKNALGATDTGTLTIEVPLMVTGTVHNNSIVGSAADDTFTMDEGDDTIVFDLLDAADATGGNGTDTWTDFAVNEDIIDISALLDDKATALNVHEYIDVQYDESTKSATISIDRDGKEGTEFESAKLLMLTNQDKTITLDDLLQNNQIIF